jgi:dihydrofolate synthase / folylpolyglutamate synthase
VNAIEYLFGLEFHGHKFGLDNIRALTAALGNPQDTFRVLHVAGTNGKGSVCAMADAALRSAGYHTGCYTSPHLIDLGERFHVDGTPVPGDDLEHAIADVRDLAADLAQRGVLRASPTFFEVATAVAFELFRRRGVEVAVIEVGLGGRLDATNVVQAPVGVITNIDLEHQQYLGETRAAIATEKAGIIKPGMRIVWGGGPADADDVVRRTCAARGATLIEAHAGITITSSFLGGRVRAAVTTLARSYPACALGLRGRHQLSNALCALRALEALDDSGVAIAPQHRIAGLEQAVWPGRLDVIDGPDGCPVLLDAAHNPAGARVLASYLEEVLPGGVTLVIGAVHDKDHRAMLAELLPHARTVIVTAPPTPRAEAADTLAGTVRTTLATSGRPPATWPDVAVEPDPVLALTRACRGSHPVCVAGSIFLAGAILAAHRSSW